MKIVIIGGSGFIGSKLVKELRKLDHIVIAASSGAANNSNAGKLGEMLKLNASRVDLAEKIPEADRRVQRGQPEHRGAAAAHSRIATAALT